MTKGMLATAIGTCNDLCCLVNIVAVTKCQEVFVS